MTATTHFENLHGKETSFLSKASIISLMESYHEAKKAEELILSNQELSNRFFMENRGRMSVNLGVKNKEPNY